MKIFVMKIATIMALVLLITSCKKEENVVVTTAGKAEVVVKMSSFSASMDDCDSVWTSGTKDAVAAYSGVKAVTLAFFKADGTQQYSSTQLRADASTYSTFGEFSLSLPLGSYTMVALGYGSEQPITLGGATEAVFTADRVRETFVATQAVNVTSTNPLTLNAELSRVVSKALVRSTDTRISGVDSVRVTFAAGGKGVNPQTGLATSNNGLVNCVVTTSAVGAVSNTVSYLFLASNLDTMNVTVEALRTDGSVYSTRTVSDVPLQRNRVTVLRGPLYSNASGAGFTVSTGWIGDTTFVDF